MGIRAFVLQREHDPSGVSGTGRAAEGVVFNDGTVALRWRGSVKSTAFFADVDAVTHIHGHNGATVLVFLDGELTVGDDASECRPLRADDASECQPPLPELAAQDGMAMAAQDPKSG